MDKKKPNYDGDYSGILKYSIQNDDLMLQNHVKKQLMQLMKLRQPYSLTLCLVFFYFVSCIQRNIMFLSRIMMVIILFYGDSW